MQAQPEIRKLQRRLERERRIRREAESIAEQGLRELFTKHQQLQLLEAIADAANHAESLPDALQAAVRSVCRFSRWQVGHAYVVEEGAGGQRLVSTSIWDGAGERHFEDFHRSTGLIEFTSGFGLPGRVLADAAPVWIGDIAAEPGFARSASAERAGLRSAAAFPVLLGTEVIAVLEYFADRVQEPEETRLRLMQKVGTQLGRVAERERAERRLIHDAFHDPLTQLPNRALFAERLAGAVAHSRRHRDEDFAVLFIDIDRFKLVNDSLGHPAGDSLITEVAARLRARLGGEHTLARLGGDEFTVLMDGIADVNDAVRTAKALMGAFDEHFAVAGEEIFASASIGIATGNGEDVTGDEVLRHADLAMYRAKTQGKGGFELYDPDMHESAVSRLALESRLRRALQDQEFVLHYQPIISLAEGSIVGVEALVRWRKSDTELVPPAEFIPVAEETGQILFLGVWVLREACSTMARWHREVPGSAGLSVSVNVSARQFAQPDFVQQVSRVIRETGIRPGALNLEITEGISMADSEHTIAVLTELRGLGVRISIDDFGTGYSSLAYLHRFPLDILKIDRSFVAQLDAGEEGRHVVQTIMNLARNLGLNVVAEGTENSGHVARLKTMGCGFAQGYYFSKPVAEEDLSRLLRSRAAGSGQRNDSCLDPEATPEAIPGTHPEPARTLRT
ncbi:putative bifunctional diguanylate cyclase/phosphodiesterase [Paeniglutamicibacter sp. R2-26]|uniref:putative bifunctional diguanylate cyclase/phosphodiesterase n=1 Tax=Paeniglutamicibacter sp. R2-26 TaxID=3144417 RepID=UPI003EE4F5F9